MARTTSLMAALCLPSDHVFCDCRLSAIVQARIVRGLSATRKLSRNGYRSPEDFEKESQRESQRTSAAAMMTFFEAPMRASRRAMPFEGGCDEHLCLSEGFSLQVFCWNNVQS